MAETAVVVVLASTLSCHIGRHSPDNSRSGLNNSIFCIPLGGATARVTPGQCQQSQCRSTLIDDYLLRPRMSVNGMARPCSRPTSNRMLGRGAKDKEHAMSQKLESTIAVIGIDIGKHSFHVVGHDERGAIVLRQKWSRGQVDARFANMPPCLVGMEACVGAHHLSRKLNSFGHHARLMPAKYV